MLETRGSSNMVSMVNSVCSLKEYYLLLSVYLEPQHHLSAECLLSSEWEKHCSSCERSINVTSKRALHLVKHGELTLILKGSLSICQRFHGWGSQFCAKSPHTSKYQKKCRFLRESLMLEKRGSSNIASIVNSLCFLKEFCLIFTVFLDEQHHLCAESPHSSEREKHCSSCKRKINFTSKRFLHLFKQCELC
jgi:hypothetical protein